MTYDYNEIIPNVIRTARKMLDEGIQQRETTLVAMKEILRRALEDGAPEDSLDQLRTFIEELDHSILES